MPLLSARLIEFIQAALERKVDVLQRQLAFWTAIVALGLLWEYGAELPKLSCEWLERKRTNRALRNKKRNPEYESPQKRFKWISAFLVLGAIAITAGVAGELFIEAAVSTAEANLRMLTDSLSVEARKETALANERAANAERDVAKAGVRIAEAKESASKADARAEEAKLGVEELRKPRKIPGDRATVDRLRAFKGTPFWVGAFPDVESTSLAESVVNILVSAGWVLRQDPTIPRTIPLMTADLEGHQIFVPMAILSSVDIRSSPGQWDAASTMERILVAAEIDAVAVGPPNTKEPTPVDRQIPMRITVGQKPPKHWANFGHPPAK